MTIQENLREKATALGNLQAHPMCWKIQEDGKKLIVVYPYYVAGVHGVRVDNTAAGMRTALEYCEKAWVQSYPNPAGWAAACSTNFRKGERK